MSFKSASEISLKTKILLCLMFVSRSNNCDTMVSNSWLIKSNCPLTASISRNCLPKLFSVNETFEIWSLKIWF